MKEVLRFDNVSMHYHSKQGETVAIKDVSFSVNEGEFVALIGPSGCGKTTILSLSAGLIKPTAGKIISTIATVFNSISILLNVILILLLM